MKSLLIERVTNGWIVRPFQPCEGWATVDGAHMIVFTNVFDLQKQLPELLDYETTEIQEPKATSHS